MIHLRSTIVEQIILFLAMIAFALLRSCSFGFHGKANIVLLATCFTEVDECRFTSLSEGEDVRLFDIIEVKEAGDFC